LAVISHEMALWMKSSRPVFKVCCSFGKLTCRLWNDQGIHVDKVSVWTLRSPCTRQSCWQLCCMGV